MSCITKRPEDRSYQSSVEKVSGIGIAGNLLLAGFKLVAGIVGHSRAMRYSRRDHCGHRCPDF